MSTRYDHSPRGSARQSPSSAAKETDLRIPPLEKLERLAKPVVRQNFAVVKFSRLINSRVA
jgi:hypothetical protein